MYFIKLATVLIALNSIAGSSCQYLGQPYFFNSWKVMGTNKLLLREHEKMFHVNDFNPRIRKLDTVQVNHAIVSGKITNMQLKQAPVEQSQDQSKLKPQPQAPLTKRAGTPKPPTPVKAIRPKAPTRHLKTLLPVGLTSWHLGGIRDLNGRHWHLPAEITNRLTVNDIDLKVEKPAGSLGPSLIPR